jgi:hypothetical protein
LNTSVVCFNKSLWHAGVIDDHDLHSAACRLTSRAINCGGHI